MATYLLGYNPKRGWLYFHESVISGEADIYDVDAGRWIGNDSTAVGGYFIGEGNDDDEAILYAISSDTDGTYIGLDSGSGGDVQDIGYFILPSVDGGSQTILKRFNFIDLYFDPPVLISDSGTTNAVITVSVYIDDDESVKQYSWTLGNSADSVFKRARINLGYYGHSIKIRVDVSMDVPEPIYISRIAVGFQPFNDSRDPDVF